MDELSIHGLALSCIVGINPHERVAEQPLRLDVTLGLNTREASRTGKISRTVHYGDVAEQVASLLRFRRYRLLEGAAEEVSWMLLGIYSRLEWVKVRVEKPRALEGLAQAASLTIVRERADFSEVQCSDLARSSFSTSDSSRAAGVFVATSEAELAILSLSPGQPLPRNETSARGLVWVLGGALHAGDEVFAAGKHFCQEPGNSWPEITSSAERTRVFLCHTHVDHA